MHLSRRLLAAGAALAVSATLPAGAIAQDDTSCSSLSTTPIGAYYLDVRDNGDPWIYEESNGIAGLQKDDDGEGACAAFDEDGEQIPGDTVIF